MLRPNNSYNRILLFFIAISIITAVLMSYYMHTLAVHPRPMYAFGPDVDHQFHYNGLLVLDGINPQGNWYPGTPLYYLYSGLLIIFGSEIEDTQRVLNISYFTCVLFSIIGLSLLFKIITKNYPWWVGMIALTTFVTWPSFFIYLNYFSSDSFVPLSTMLVTIAVWKSLYEERKDLRWTILVGISMGLIVSMKVTAIPVVLTVALILTIREIKYHIRRPNNDTSFLKLLLNISILPLSIFASFIFFIFPTINNLPQLVLFVLQKSVKNSPSLIESSWNSISTTAQIAPFAFTTAALTLAVFCISIFVAKCLVGKDTKHRFKYQGDPKFDYLSANILIASLFLLTMATLYRTVGTATDGGNISGILFRQTAPSAIVFPLMVLYSYHLTSPSHRLIRPLYRFQWFFLITLSLASLAVITWSITAAVRWRMDTVDNWHTEIAPIAETLDSITPPGTRMAIYWPWYGREESFHWRANSGHGHNRYAQKILEAFPRHTLLDGLAIKHVLEKTTENQPNQDMEGVLRRIHTLFRKVFPQEDYSSREEIIYGLDSGEPIGIIAYPTNAPNSLGLDATKFQHFIKSYLSSSTVEKMSIGTEEWVLLHPREELFKKRPNP